MPQIPVNIEDLPVSFTPLDDSLVYGVMCRGASVAGPDKNGDMYITAEFEVQTPEEHKGRRLFDNYIAIPRAASPDMDGFERRKLLERGVRLARFIKALRVRHGAAGFELEDALGQECQITVKNEEYDGEVNSKVKKYMIPD